MKTEVKTASELARSTPPSPLQVAFRELEFFDVGDPARVEDVFSPDLIDHNPANPEKPGIEGMRALIEGLRAGFTNSVHRILFYRELPDDWVLVHWEMTATHTGEFLGVPATGKPVALKGIDIFHIVGGKVAEIYHVEEMLKLAQQLGVQSA
ncbi:MULTISPECIES: ester cyclase [Priestia]|uniref:ester cyclase n=1 Tax=Priestia TaxID=2800373 RepID=UPI001ADA2EEB|nr:MULTISPECIES: ester cyclase [Priestia]QTL51223.1 ester cyclase [Priestia aryabhattai]USL44196.1 ester cyclase [Priestia megaterium]